MRTEQVSIFKYEELSDKAKAKAREWYRSDDGGLDYDWFDAVYEDAGRIFEILGIDANRKGKNPCIWFSGFWSQGDGACFEGSYSYAKGSARAIKRYAPQDEELQRIGRELMEVQKRHNYRITARLEHRGPYYHEYTVSIDVDGCDDSGKESPAETVRTLLRDLMRWTYKTLEAEHEYLTSDEAVAETIEANEYEFTADGDRYA